MTPSRRASRLRPSENKKPVTLSLPKGLPIAVNSRAIQRHRLPDQILRLAPLAQDDSVGKAPRSG